jgi:hypothetical protein
MDLIGGQSTYGTGGANNDGKGQPARISSLACLHFAS